MTNREKYKQAFSALHISDEFTVVVSGMKTNRTKKTIRMSRAAAVCAVLVLVLGCVMAAACAVGALSNIRLWINGEEVDPDEYARYISVDEEGNYAIETGALENGMKVTAAADYEGGTEPELSPLVDVRYEYRTEDQEGRDYLIVTETATGRTEEVDVTGKLENGCYEDTMTVFGIEIEVALKVEEGKVSWSFSYEENN